MSMLADDHTMVARLRAVHDLLVKYGPDHFNMSAWLSIETDNPETADVWQDLCAQPLCDLEWLTTVPAERVLTPCGTTACLAGFAALASQNSTLHESWDVADWLGMNVACTRPGILLGKTSTDWFFVSRWPAFATASLDRKYNRGLTYRQAEHQVVVDILSDLIAGRRANWWDAGEQDAQSA